jgi:hypothetical protein
MTLDPMNKTDAPTSGRVMRVTLSLPTAKTGAIDSLVWKAEVDLSGLWGTELQHVVVHAWQGDITFYHRSDLEGGGISIPATLVGEENHVRWSQRAEPLTFSTHLPGDAFERIERFRSAGSLCARLEGKLNALALGPQNYNETARLQLLMRSWTVGGMTRFNEVHCEPRDVRDRWIEHVLPAFGKPHRVLIEAMIPKLAPDSEHGKRAVGHLQEADRAFIHGHYEQAAHVAYKALEALQQLLEPVEGRYGLLVRSQLTKQINAVHGITHKGRHDESKEPTPPIEFDRNLAMHIITSVKSIAGAIFGSEAQ